MRTIIVGLRDRTQHPYPESDLRAYWQQGRIPADALYWTEGMAEWRPITELLGYPPGVQQTQAGFTPAAPSVPSYGQQAAQGYLPQAYPQAAGGPAPYPYPGVTTSPAQGGYQPSAHAGGLMATAPAETRRFEKDPAGLTRALTASLWAYAGLAGVGLGIAAYAMLNPGRPGLTYYAFQQYLAQSGMLAIVVLIELIVTIVLFCMWVYRANTNVRGFGADGLEFTPAWAVGCFFVPILSLYRPYQAMSEIWRASRDPANWRSVAGSSVVGGWWAFYLLSGLGGMIAGSALSSVHSAGDIQMGLGITMLSDTLNIISAVAAVGLVKSTYRAQCEYVAKRM